MGEIDEKILYPTHPYRSGLHIAHIAYFGEHCQRAVALDSHGVWETDQPSEGLRFDVLGIRSAT